VPIHPPFRNHGSPRTRRPSFAVLLVTAALSAACGGGSTPALVPDAGGPPSGAPLPGASSIPQVYEEQFQEAQLTQGTAKPTSVPTSMPPAATVRFLNQATFGATRDEREKAQAGWRWGWLQQQWATPVDKTHWDLVRADQAAWLAANPGTEAARVPNLALDWSVWEAYLTAPDQLRKRVGYALSQIMVVSMNGLAFGGTNNALLAAGYLDTLEQHAFGNFRDLLEAVTLNPAMGYYLSHRANRRAEYPNNDPTKPPLRVPDENYAREVMQLFTIGLYDLEPDGRLKTVDGQPRETYGEADVQGLARVFTGWDWAARTEPDWQRKPMVFTAARHSPEEKKFLGTTIPAGTSGPDSLKIALDTLFRHPNTAPFIGKQLIQRLTTSSPSPAYVGRVAAKFADNGEGVRGDMKAVIDAVLRDPEARSSRNITAPDPGWGKLREPVVRFTTFARAFGVRTNEEIWRLGDLSNPATGLGQSPMRSPSVFNFYRPGYVPPGGGIASAQLTAPEFQITTDTSVPGYVNFVQRMLTNPPQGISFDYAGVLALAGDPAALVAHLNLELANEAMGTATRDEITAAVAALPAVTDPQKLARVRAAIVMTMAAPEFVVQK
jgi:uncharacterized protein (DUF1800 family)